MRRENGRDENWPSQTRETENGETKRSRTLSRTRARKDSIVNELPVNADNELQVCMYLPMTHRRIGGKIAVILSRNNIQLFRQITPNDKLPFASFLSYAKINNLQFNSLVETSKKTNFS